MTNTLNDCIEKKHTRMGRKPLPPGMRRDHMLQLFLRRDEYLQIFALAKENRRTASAEVVYRVWSTLPKEKPKRTPKKEKEESRGTA
jgi:hypothetical protein